MRGRCSPSSFVIIFCRFESFDIPVDTRSDMFATNCKRKECYCEQSHKGHDVVLFLYIANSSSLASSTWTTHDRFDVHLVTVSFG